MKLLVWATLVCLTGVQAGCILMGDGLDFPAAPVSRDAQGLSYDVNGDGRAEFFIRANDAGDLDVLGYDDDGDGQDDRRYRLSEYPVDRVPHLILLLDSIPYQHAAGRAGEAGWSWFGPASKVIPPFPTMSGVIFTRLLHAPPINGMINQHYDRAAGKRQDQIFARASGHRNPWERRLHYRLKYWENGLAFLRPRPCFATELARVKRAVDDSPDRVTLAYVASTSGMVSKYGESGIEEVLDGVERLCACLFFERRGAIKISVMADHGHNLVAGKRVDLQGVLKSAGFSPRHRLAGVNDVVIELDGLVNYAGVHTRRAADVAAAVTARPEFELAMYQEGERIIVRSAAGRAAIEHRSGKFRYAALEADVLGYLPVVDGLAAQGMLDSEGFAPDRAWLEATGEHHWPDAPRRLWDAFHGLAVNTPDVLITTVPGHYVGLASMEKYVTMASTHGGFDQADSATFVLTMTGRGRPLMRTHEVLPLIEPSFNPDRLRR